MFQIQNLNFETPLIIAPHMAIEEIFVEIDKMILREDITKSWLNHEISTSDYLDLINQQNIDVFDLVKTWESNIVLI